MCEIVKGKGYKKFGGDICFRLLTIERYVEGGGGVSAPPSGRGSTMCLGFFLPLEAQDTNICSIIFLFGILSLLSFLEDF